MSNRWLACRCPKWISAMSLCMALIACVVSSVHADGLVDDARLLAAAGDATNWIMFGHDYSNHRFAALDQITASNVRQLVPAWIHQTGIVGTFQTHPLVVDGVMYLTTPHNHVQAVNAETGAVMWRYQHTKRTERTRGGSSNRGAAVAYGKVFQATNDGRLIALDQHTGNLVWDVVMAKPAPGEAEALASLGTAAQQALIAGVDTFPAKMPPLVHQGRVIVGVISAGYGIYQDLTEQLGIAGPPEAEVRHGRRGYLAAFDADTGEELWRWHTTKPDAWEGAFRETTPDGVPLNRDIVAEKAAAAAYKEAWRSGGGSTWMTPALDTDLGLLYLGTGNASPSDAEWARPGDNLYTNSLVALDVQTGKLRWFYQQVPHDIWGYDVASQPVLFDVATSEGNVAGVGVASKNGWFYAHDRATGKLLFKSEPFVPQHNLFAPATPDGVVVSPGSFGGASWSPVSYSPITGYVYVAAIHKPTRLTLATLDGSDGGEPITFIVNEPAPDAPNWGTLSAIDLQNDGRLAWQVKTAQPLVGGVLATAGGLVFVGEGDGHFKAFDAKTGAELWRFNCGAGVNAPPMSYAVNGRQYIAVAAGGSGIFGYRTGDAVMAFTIPKRQ